MIRTIVGATVLGIPIGASGTMARERHFQEVSVQGAGFFTKDSNGNGIDYDLSKHFTLRAEYRGFVYGRPDFGLTALHSGATAHTALPSAGIVLRY